MEIRNTADPYFRYGSYELMINGRRTNNFKFILARQGRDTIEAILPDFNVEWFFEKYPEGNTYEISFKGVDSASFLQGFTDSVDTCILEGTYSLQTKETFLPESTAVWVVFEKAVPYKESEGDE